MAQRREKEALVQLLDLPEELLLATFSLLEVWDLCALSSVCFRLHDLAADDSLWRPLCGTLCSSDQRGGYERSRSKNQHSHRGKAGQKNLISRMSTLPGCGRRLCATDKDGTHSLSWILEVCVEATQSKEGITI